ncbi:hypothetical protein [Segetibacter sp.]|jgi:hypothetical protein|uniref:hypothetical protein n=1 Tax=Segetibacter sp. TaxID=2231182 RepID=UPI002602CEDC|nr:hypothetical protein [Segetibacter sp.]MCW3079174.1 hypothetical protein [Segetibacter sp.]
MKKLRLIALGCIVTILACNEPVTKKVLVIGRGKITVQDNNVTMTDGTGYVEETVELKGDKAVSWNVTTGTGKTTVNVPEEKGIYILNLKTDTIVGSQQNIGQDLSGRTMTQEELKGKIDSLVELTKGANVSPGSHNYFILPNQLVKISPDMEAKIFGPFTKIPGSIEADKDGKLPPIFKFYTNTEMRDLIARLKKNTI